MPGLVSFLDYTMLKALRLIFRQAHVLFLKALRFFDSLIRLDFQKTPKFRLKCIKNTYEDFIDSLADGAIER